MRATSRKLIIHDLLVVCSENSIFIHDSHELLSRWVGGHSTGRLAGELDASLGLPLELLPQVAGEGAARLGGQGDTVAGQLKLGLGHQALARAGDISNFVVVVVTTETTKLVLQQVRAFQLDPLAIKEHTDLGGLENHYVVLGPWMEKIVIIS